MVVNFCRSYFSFTVTFSHYKATDNNSYRFSPQVQLTQSIKSATKIHKINTNRRNCEITDFVCKKTCVSFPAPEMKIAVLRLISRLAE